MHPPLRILPHIERFAREILAGSQKPAPIIVDQLRPPLLPEGSASARLPARLGKLITARGGQAETGWAIRERPGVYLEAELTAVWRQPGGTRLFLATPGPRLCEERIKLLRKGGLRDRNQLIGKTPEMRRAETDIRWLLETINNRYGSW